VATNSTLPPQAAFHHAVLRHLARHPEGDRRRNIHETIPDLMGLTEALDAPSAWTFCRALPSAPSPLRAQRGMSPVPAIFREL
jgi:hypothetical protein